MKQELPPRPSLENLKKQAKTILKGHQSADADILQRIQEHHPGFRKSRPGAIAKARFTLADAQRTLANEYGFRSWGELKARVEQEASGRKIPNEEAVKALRDAACRGDLERLAALLDANSSLVNERGGEGTRTALHDAAGQGQEAAVEFLLKRGANPNIRCEGDYAFPLHFACERERFAIVRLLVEHGADTIGEGDYHELGVIGWATAWDWNAVNKEIVDYLLAHGARHNIFSAVAMGEVEAIRKLVAESRTNLDRRMDYANKRGRPVHLAVTKRQPGSLQTLLDLGADMEAVDEASFTALDVAGLLGEKELAQVLLDRGAKLRLPAAVGLGRTREMNQLLRDDPDCLKPGHRWGNLIVRAAEWPSSASGALVASLIRAGADVNVRDDPKTSVDATSGYTPLHAAAFRGNKSAAAVLLQHGARVTTREEKYHGTPAGWADYAGHRHVRDLILQGPVDIIEAIQYGMTERVRAVLAEDPGALDRPFRDYGLFPYGMEEWYTPLVEAVTRGHAEITRVLLDHGANALIRSPEGRTLIEMAREKKHREIAELLAAQESPGQLGT
jgi:ankyrin repeat protein